MTRLRAFTLGGLAVALLAAVLLSSFASGNPDGLESAVLRTQCAEAEDADACLGEAAGDPVYTAAPLPDYALTPLSGFLGVLATFALGAGTVAVLRRR